jgi:hypothetical protein
MFVFGRLTGKPKTAPLSSLRYLRIVFASKLVRAASSAGARLMAAASHAVLQKPKTGMRQAPSGNTPAHPPIGNISNHDDFFHPHPARKRRTVVVRLKDLSPGENRLTIHRIGYDCNDPHSRCLEPGSPPGLSREPVAELNDLPSEETGRRNRHRKGAAGTLPSPSRGAGMTSVSLHLRLNNNDLQVLPSVHP